MTEKRTREIIDFLAKDATATAAGVAKKNLDLRSRTFARFWILGGVLVLGLSYWLLPTREDLRARLGAFDTPILFALWSAATLLPAIKVYALAFPDGRLAPPLEKMTRFAATPLVLLAGWAIARFRFEDVGFQLYRESSILNGGCGAVIVVAGVVHASFLFAWIRRGGTTSPARAGAWAAVSTASFASFIVQFACANENPLHVLLWHFAPLAFLTFVAGISAKRLLRW